MRKPSALKGILEFQLLQIPIRDWNLLVSLAPWSPPISITTNPYQGLKQPQFVTRAFIYAEISITTNPYQGLKPTSARLADRTGIFQLLQIPIRDWNVNILALLLHQTKFQLLQIPIRDWNLTTWIAWLYTKRFQLLQIPIRDWNWETVKSHWK